MTIPSNFLAALKKIPPMPPSVGRLLSVLSQDDYELSEISEIIQFDPILTAEVLSLSNSVQNAGRNPITNVKQAVSRLGGNQISKFVLGKQVQKRIPSNLIEYGMEEGDLWAHGVATALAAETLSIDFNKGGGELAFTSGLLHDIGKTLIPHLFPISKIQNIWKQATLSSKTPIHIIEQEILGTDHAEIGAELLNEWKLPQEIIEAVRYHHEGGEVSSLVDCIRISDLVARLSGVGMGNEGVQFDIDMGTFLRIGISREGFEILCLETREKLQSVLDAYQEF